MKIAVLMASAGSRLGGLETIAREFASGLAGRGHDVTLVTGVGPGAALQPDLRSDVQGAVSVANPAGLARLALPYRLARRAASTSPWIMPMCSRVWARKPKS